jgi:hypothetical protein
MNSIKGISTMIFPGTSVENSAGRTSKVGPLILLEGVWYGLVPNHNFKGEATVREAGTGLVIGNIIRKSARERHDGYTDISDAFSVVKFLSVAPIQVSKRQRVACVDPIDVIGQRLLKGEATGHTAAKLNSIDGPFWMQSGDEIQHFMGAFGVDAADDGVILAQLGDAGSSILSDSGNQLVGILLGAADGIYYGAPAVDLLARHFPGFDAYEMVA